MFNNICNCKKIIKNNFVDVKSSNVSLSFARFRSNSILVLLLLAVWQNVTCLADDATPAAVSREADSDNWLDFTHEKCMKEVLITNQYKKFHSAEDYFGPDGIFEILVRFKGIADGHVILTMNATADEPKYTISLGSYNNRFSEIRRLQPIQVGTKVSTPSIMSDMQFRGFIVRYDPHDGHLSVFGEGSEVPLIHLEDSNPPLNIRFFSFATWHNRVVQVAFNCVSKDAHSLVNLQSTGCQTKIVVGDYSDITDFYAVDSFVSENGVLELLIRFKGVSDGHVVLSEYANISNSQPSYIVIMGSYENKVSEIRRLFNDSVFRINTPGILSSSQFRGFLIRYNEKRGEIRVYSEGSYMPLLYWQDESPLKIRYFSFSAYHTVVLDVAFNCKAKDLHSLIFQHKPG